MNKFRIYLDKNKETVWLNEMAKEGYSMKSFFAGFYTFDTCEPGKYEYQIDCSDGFGNVSSNYREFMKEFDIEVLQCWGPWVYLRKEASDEPFKLYTDVDSMIEHYTRIRNMYKFVTLLELVIFILEIMAAMNGSKLGFLFTLLIGLFVIAFMQATLKTNETILKLKERKGEKVNRNSLQTGNVSPFLIIGLLLNSLPFAVRHFGGSETIVSIIQIIAIVFLMIGIYKTRHVFASSKSTYTQ